MANPRGDTLFEKILEGGLFKSRWILAPFYVGLVIALAMLLVVFVRELAHSLQES